MEANTLEVLERNRDLLAANDDYALWQVVSRGTRPSRGKRQSSGATVAIYCIAVNFSEFCNHYVEGVSIVIPSTRRIPPQSLEAKAKITNKMNHIVASFEAKQVDPKAIPLMLDLDGNVSESNAHNFFAVIDRRIYTPGAKNVLGGVTLASLKELAEQLKIEVLEANLTPYDCLNADEAFLASTSPTIVPIRSINGIALGDGAPGNVTLQLMKAWTDLVGVDIVRQAIDHMEGDEKTRLLAAWKDKQVGLAL